MDERWKKVEDGAYEISDLGRLRRAKASQGASVGAVVTSSVDRDGYRIVGMWIAGKKVYRRVHRLVAAAFIQNPSSKRQVNHRDGDKGNNGHTNLEWVTDQENKDHAWSHGLCADRFRLTSDLRMLAASLLGAGMSQSAVARQIGVGQSTISRMVRAEGKHSHV